MSSQQAADDVTTGHRTHRYLRLALAFVVFALLTGVVVESIRIHDVLPSISHYFYTPARNAFVGALVAASLALVALSGRDRETVLLDVAAVFAPVIALVPTGINPDEPEVAGLSCPGPGECVPAEHMPDVYNGVITYAVVVFAVVIVGAVVHRKRFLMRPGLLLPGAVGMVTAILLLLLAFWPAWNDGFPFNAWPLESIHYMATILFFGCFAAVPILNAFWRTTESRPTKWQKVLYLVVAGLMGVTLVALMLAPLYRDEVDFPVVFAGEGIALVLFAVFWVVQTFQRWNEVDQPSLMATTRLPWDEVG